MSLERSSHLSTCVVTTNDMASVYIFFDHNCDHKSTSEHHNWVCSKGNTFTIGATLCYHLTNSSRITLIYYSNAVNCCWHQVLVQHLPTKAQRRYSQSVNEVYWEQSVSSGAMINKNDVYDVMCACCYWSRDSFQWWSGCEFLWNVLATVAGHEDI